jgi:drug/metabolite transporter (DMT)-like permease
MPPPSPSNLTRVIFWMTGALLSFSTFAIAIRQLAGKLSIFEILTIRNTAGVAVFGIIALASPVMRGQLRTKRPFLHLTRNLVHWCAQFGWSTALLLLPLATVFALEFTAPLWTALLAVLFLGERMTVNRLVTTLLGFLGVLVIVRPGLQSFQPAALLVLAVAFGFAVTFILTKKLTATESTFAILFWMNVIQLPLNIIGSDLSFPARLVWSDGFAVAAIAITGIASHFCLTNAFRYGDAILVVPLDFLRIPLIALVGWMFYNEAIDLAVLLGAGLIIVGIVWNLIQERTPAIPPDEGGPKVS